LSERLLTAIEPCEASDAVKTLWRRGEVYLTKPDTSWLLLHASPYAGNERDDWFFHSGQFNVILLN